MMAEDRSDLIAQVREALRDVIDPELGYNIVDLGFIYDIAVEAGAACITMTTTSRGCPAGSFLKEGAVNSALQVPGIETADVILTFDPPWRPAMIAPEVKASLGFAEVN
jgi:metal-sulfur cluster biosynthetic enzyme